MVSKLRLHVRILWQELHRQTKQVHLKKHLLNELPVRFYLVSLVRSWTTCKVSRWTICRIKTFTVACTVIFSYIVRMHRSLSEWEDFGAMGSYSVVNICSHPDDKLKCDRWRMLEQLSGACVKARVHFTGEQDNLKLSPRSYVMALASQPNPCPFQVLKRCQNVPFCSGPSACSRIWHSIPTAPWIQTQAPTWRSIFVGCCADKPSNKVL